MRVKILKVNSEFLVELFKPGLHPAYECIDHGLPEDAKITDAFIPFPEPFVLWLKIESETFPEVKNGCKFETLESPVMKKCLRKGGESR